MLTKPHSIDKQRSEATQNFIDGFQKQARKEAAVVSAERQVSDSEQDSIKKQVRMRALVRDAGGELSKKTIGEKVVLDLSRCSGNLIDID